MKRFFFSLLLVAFYLLVLLPKATFAYIDNIKSADGNYFLEINLFNKDLADQGDSEGSQQVKAQNKLWVVIKAFKNTNGQRGDQVTDFFKGNEYSYQLISPSGQNCFNSNNATIGVGLKDGGDNLYAELANSSGNIVRGEGRCNFDSGNWTMSVWKNPNTVSYTPSESDYIFRNFIFTAQTKEGGIPTHMEYFDDQKVSKLICSNQDIKFKLVNAVYAHTYTFWWDGAITSAFRPPQPTSDHSILVLTMPRDGLSSKNPIKLCMYNGYIIPGAPGVVCSDKAGQSLSFDQTTADPACFEAKQKQCVLKGINTGADGKYVVTLTASGLGLTVNNPIATLSPGDVSTPAKTGSNGDFLFDFKDGVSAGTYSYKVVDASGTELCSGSQEISEATVENPNTPKTPEPKCNFENPRDPNFCASGAGEACGNNGINTAIGCIPTEPMRFIAGMMKYVLGFGGGVALLLMIFGSFGMITSSGNPDAIKKGREQFVNAIIGLLFIIFSTLFMEILGVDILGLPGFS